MEKTLVVEVEWLDACSYDDSTVRSVGRLLSQTEDQIVLCRDFYQKDGGRDELEVSGVLCIPTKWIKNMRTLDA
ncbi:hypothetical protein A2Z67_05085 [Candidatus Woesebacteria bacterium RBG_13_36_22]|uniref:Uncharacterized protein n=1 Tax=Candidatus Woesebacteria bacterium RBG_13_36_22 TaxID=1802478 RepID=A0A1F7X2I1_9BACT|nr:MAG: hypothetical protein A2Z67_05085 [Candidatus Woesebacteria bacterium RBG_13_36_22]